MTFNICVSLAGSSVKDCLRALEGVEMAEIRLDKMQLSEQDIQRIFSQPVKLVATCRPGKRDDAERKRLLLAAIDAGAAYVDVEVDASDAYKRELVERAGAKKCKVIVSFHDYKKTPARGELEQIVQWCFESGADMAKIACQVNNEKDAARLLGLLDSERPIVVVGMGAKGRIIRVLAPLLGSPFTYASRADGKETAEGQLGIGTMKRVLDMLKEELK